MYHLENSYDKLLIEEENKNFEDVPFAEMENTVFNTSVPYRDSTAFRMALQHIACVDTQLYKELIHIEYKEMTA